MPKPLQIKLIKTLLVISVVLLAHLPYIDELAETYTEQGIKRTLVTFAVSRGLNGVISVAQGTEVAVAPAGVGITLAPGEILDPINDLVERFSWVVLASGTSLGIQRLFLEMSASTSLTVILTLSAFIVLLLIWYFRPLDEEKNIYSRYLVKAFLILIILRFSIPVIALLNEALYLHFLQPQYEEAQLELEGATEKIKTINQTSHTTPPEEKSFLDRAETWFSQAQHSLDIGRRLDALKEAVSEISQQVINMIVGVHRGFVSRFFRSALKKLLSKL